MVLNKITTAAIGFIFANSAFAFEPISENVTGVPELDGGLAFLAIGLTAALLAVVKERRG